MKKLTATLIGQYVNKKGNDVFRYKVTGSPDAMEAYESVQGDYHREDEETGNVLWFSSRFCGDTATLVVNEDTSKVYADMSEFKKIASLSSQFGGALGQEIARQGVSKLLGRKAVEPVETKQEEPAKS